MGLARRDASTRARARALEPIPCPQSQSPVRVQAIGFAAISAVPEHIRFEQDLRVSLDMVRRRDLNSQLLAISDRVYEEGIARLERQLAYGGAAQMRTDHICLLTIRGDR